MRPILASLILLAALWALARGLEGFGLIGFTALILTTAVPIVLQGGWAAALDRGHQLDRFAPGSRLRALLSGWLLRLAWRFVLAVAVVASTMLYRLHSGGPELLCLAAAPFVFAALLQLIKPLTSAEMRPQFALAQSLTWAKWGTVAVLLVLVTLEEMSQSLLASRSSSLMDLLFSIAGLLAGAVVALLFQEWSSRRRLPEGAETV